MEEKREGGGGGGGGGGGWEREKDSQIKTVRDINIEGYASKVEEIMPRKRLEGKEFARFGILTTSYCNFLDYWGIYNGSNTARSLSMWGLMEKDKSV